MKKINFLFSSAIALGLAFCLGTDLVKASAAGDSWSNPLYNQAPALQEVDSASFITPIWSSQVGSTRVDDNQVVVHDLSGWGYRAQLPGRRVDIGSFHIKLDLEGMSNNNALMLIFGTAAGSYSTEGTKLLTIDLVKATTSNDLYQTVVSTTEHNVSIPSYNDGQKWADDANYTGVQVSATNNKIDVRISKDNESTSRVIINGVETVVNNSEMFEKCVDGTQAYFALGFVNAAFGEQYYVCEEIGDASDELYKSAAGAFGKVKAGLAELKGKQYSATDPDTIVADKAKFDALPFSKLYSFDKEWFKADYTAIQDSINAAIEAAGPALKLQLFEGSVEDMEAAQGSLDTVEGINTLIDLKKIAERQMIEISGLTLEDSLKTKFDGLVARYNTVADKIVPAIKAVYDAKISAFESAADSKFADATAYNQAITLRGNIPTLFNQYLDDATVEAYVGRINAANAKVKAQVTLDNKNYVQGSDAAVIKKADESFDLVSIGNIVGKAPESSSALYVQEKISVRDFSMKFSIDRIPSSVGAWMTIGVMEKPECFSTAEDVSVQNNKGIFFLFTKINSQTIGVQAFILTLTCNRFYDAPLTQNLTIPMATEINLTFKEVTKTIAGVSGTYFEMAFNGVTFDKESITVNKIKTSLETREGHLMIGSSGGSANDPAIMNIKDINGFKPDSASIKKTIAVEAPTSTDQEKSFEEGKTSGTVVFNLDTHNESLTSVTCDGQKIATSNYSYSNNKLTLKNAFLKTLKAGDHAIVATTDGGSVTWNLKITPAGGGQGDDPGPQPSKGGCGGSIIAASALVAGLATIGIVLVSRKRKED